jgi:hypothetical protein
VGSFSKKILRLKLWKDLDPVKVIEEKKLPVIMRVLIPTLCAGIALIISSVVISNVN